MPSWTLPWPKVTVNHLYEFRGLRRRLTPAAQAWKDEAIVIVRQWHIDQRLPLVLPEGRLRFQLRYWPPRDGRKHDPSNLLKLSEDAIFAAYFADDERIWQTEAIRQDRSDTPRLIVRIEALGEVKGET